MATLTVNSVTKAGVADIGVPMVAADVLGDTVGASSGILIAMTNGDASPHTLTIAAPAASAVCGSLGALDVDPITLVVAAGDTGFLAVPLGYNDASNNFTWTYDAITSVTIGVFSIAP